MIVWPVKLCLGEQVASALLRKNQFKKSSPSVDSATLCYYANEYIKLDDVLLSLANYKKFQINLMLTVASLHLRDFLASVDILDVLKSHP